MTDLSKRAEAWQERYELAAPFRSGLEHDANDLIQRIVEIEASNADLDRRAAEYAHASNQQAQRIAELEAESARLRADAELIDWIESNQDLTIDRYFGSGWKASTRAVSGGRHWGTWATFRAAISEALKQKRSNG